MADKSVAEKLLIKEGYLVTLLNEPENYRAVLGALPAGVEISTQPSGPADLVQVFITSQRELEGALPGVRSNLKPSGLLWITYPKGTSRVKADVNRDTIREYAEARGFKAVAMISVDDTWSALRLKLV